MPERQKPEEPAKWAHLDAPRRLKKWREDRAALTQRAAADAIGIDLTKYNAFEMSRKRPGLDIAAAIERVTKGYVRATQWSQSLADARRMRDAA